MEKSLENLFSCLPCNYKITQEQIIKFWDHYIDKIHFLFQNQKYAELTKYILDSVETVNLTIFPLSRSTFSKLIITIYQIITDFPIKSYDLYLATFSLIYKFKNKMRKPLDIVLDWKPLYKVFKFFITKEPLHLVISISNYIGYVVKSICFLSQYFRPECSNIIKNKFFPKICLYSSKAQLSFIFFTIFYPPQADYHLWLPYMISELKEFPSNSRTGYILQLLYRTMLHHIMDDFSSILPIVFHLIERSLFNTHNDPVSCADISLPFYNQLNTPVFLISHYLGRVTFLLMLSPPTRNAALSCLKVITARSHLIDTVEGAYRIIPFIEAIINQIYFACHDMVKGYLPLPSSLCPYIPSLSDDNSQNSPNHKNLKNIQNNQSDTLLHDIISQIVESRITLFRNFGQAILAIDSLNAISKECFFDPLAAKRYREFAILCTEITDPPNIAELGWMILRVVWKTIKDTSEIKLLIGRAALTLGFKEVRLAIFKFYFSVFSEYHITDPSLVHLVFDSIFTFLRVIDISETYHFTTLNFIYYATIEACTHSNEAFNALFDVFFQYCTDYSLANKGALTHINLLSQNFSLFATKEMKEKILQKLTPLISSTKDPKYLKFLSYIYTNCTIFNDFIHTNYYISTNFYAENHLDDNDDDEKKKRDHEWNEEKKKQLEVFMPLLKSKEIKIKKIALHTIVKSLSLMSSPTPLVKNDELIYAYHDFPDDLFASIIIPYLEILEKSNNVTEIQDTIKILFLALYTYLRDDHRLESGDLSQASEFLRESLFYNPKFEQKTKYSFRERIINIIVRLLTDFETNQQIAIRALRLSEMIFKPIVNLMTDPADPLQSLISQFWYAFPGKANPPLRFLVKCTSLLELFRTQSIIPITPSISELIKVLFKMSISKNTSIQSHALNTLGTHLVVYTPLFQKIFSDFFFSFKSFPIDEFSPLLQVSLTVDLIAYSNEISSKIFYYFITTRPEKNLTLKVITRYIIATARNTFPNNNEPNSTEIWLNTASKISKFVQEQNKYFNDSDILQILVILLQIIKFVSQFDKVLSEFIISQVSSCNSTINGIAVEILIILLVHKRRSSKTRISFGELSNLSQIPSLLNLAKVTTSYQNDDDQTHLSNPSDILENADVKDDETVDAKDDENVDAKDDENVVAKDNETVDAKDNETVDAKDDETVDAKDEEEYMKELEQMMKEAINNQYITNSKKFIAKVQFNVSREDYLLFEQLGNTFYIIPDHFYEEKFEFLDIPMIHEYLRKIIIAFNELQNPNSANIRELHVLFWKVLAQVMGPYLLPGLITIISEEFFARSMNNQIAATLSEIITAITPNIGQWNNEDIELYYEQIVIPFIEKSLHNLEISPLVSICISNLAIYSNPSLLAPLFVYLSQSQDTSYTSFTFLDCLIHPRSLCYNPIIKTLYDNDVKPNLLKDISIQDQINILQLFGALLEGTCFHKLHPLRKNPENVTLMNELSHYIADEISELYKTINITSKKDAYFCSLMFQLISGITSASAEHLLSVIIDNMETAMLCFNCYSSILFDHISDSFFTLTISELFFRLPHLIQPFIEKSVQQFSKISYPIKIMILDGLIDVVSLNETNLTPEILTLCYSITKDICKDAEVTVQYKAVLLFSYIIFSEANFLQLQTDKSEKMNVITAAAIIINSQVFDYIPNYLKEALSVIETEFDGKMKKLLKYVLERFWRKNHGCMLPALEEELDHYHNLLFPSYFC